MTRPPAPGWLKVRLPYAVDNRRFLDDLIGSARLRQDPVNRGNWLVARAHLTRVVEGIYRSGRVDDVRVALEHSAGGRCVEACFTGSDDSEAILRCECSCLGLNHGSQAPPENARLVGYSVAGGVYVFPGHRRTFMYSEIAS